MALFDSHVMAKVCKLRVCTWRYKEVGRGFSVMIMCKLRRVSGTGLRVSVLELTVSFRDSRMGKCVRRGMQ